MSESTKLNAVLKQYFGYDSFRPLQESIIADALAGKDVMAVLPTGAGKSLCFQIPSLVKEGTTIVISPLIALMKNQVDLLTSNGIPATFLNSSLTQEENRLRRQQLLAGNIRILYVSPERLAISHLASETARLQIDLLAVDEAHCVSEWGHDFRPEYRQLSELRKNLEHVPMMALTATATERVREDITSALALKIEKPFIASFDRHNLTYRVTEKNRSLNQILAFLGDRPDQSGIIYCHSRKGVDRLSDQLVKNKIDALPYHAGLDRETRSKNQDAFIRDECQIICATIAFGMGIDKPNVRFVIHQDLPKNVESYYQETGRAGRDGLPSDCLLLFSPGDAAKQHHFIDEKTSETEKEVAREQLRLIIHYAENDDCRRASLLEYFGEITETKNCQSCDNCLEPKETFDGTIPAQKILSCIFRIYQQSGFSVGVNHVVEVLTGANTEKIRKWKHDSLSTYNIGQEFGRDEWAHLVRQLIRKKLVSQNQQQFSTLLLTPDGNAFLKAKPDLPLTRPPKKRSPQTQRAIPQSEEFDPKLFENLRLLRKQLAQEKGVPAYIILSDVTLRHISRHYPQTNEDLLNIHGIGAAKLQEHGQTLLDEVNNYLQSNEKAVFKDTY
ncbi:DNA helicase RecQ [Verrucomicrobia bacterium]|jgi:ATP-dependent DNA helicase RecQ|nr:DNA helicase RecQ [Verrucomicrobiota bacterium]